MSKREWPYLVIVMDHGTGETHCWGVQAVDKDDAKDKWYCSSNWTTCRSVDRVVDDR